MKTSFKNLPTSAEIAYDASTLGGYGISDAVALSAAAEQSISSDVQINGWLRVGNLSVDGEVSPVDYDGRKIARALGGLLSNDLDDDLKKQLGVAQGFRYKLVNGVLQHGTVSIPGIQEGDCDFIHVEDYSITTITLSTMNDVVIYLPAAVDGRCRDLVLKVKIETETAPEHIAFVSESGEPIAFETDDDDWSNLEPGINYMLFTETERS